MSGQHDDIPVRVKERPPRVDLVIAREDKRNALTTEMMDRIVDSIDRAGRDDDVKAIVIRAEGSTFTAGFDITDPADFAGLPTHSVRERVRAVAAKADWMRRIFHAECPTVVQVQGACIGIGTMMVLAADFVIASDDARFGFPEERFGSAGSTWAYAFLTASIGLKRATELLMTGRQVAAAEMYQLGLVNRVVPAGRLADEVNELVAALSTLPRDGIAVNRAVKRLVAGQLGYDSSFDTHAVVHPLAERITRAQDEYDFIRSVERCGVRGAIAERNERFGGSWWGW